MKKAHVGTIPGIEEFLAEFTSERAWGEEGYLADKGLIPMPEDERKQFAAEVKNLNGAYPGIDKSLNVWFNHAGTVRVLSLHAIFVSGR